MKKLFVILLSVSHLFCFGCKEKSYEADIIELDKTECIAGKDGGEFQIKVLDSYKKLSLGSFSPKTAEELQLYVSENKDTLQTYWYKAVLIQGEKSSIQITVFPNESLSDREEYLGIFTDNCSNIVRIMQSAF